MTTNELYEAGFQDAITTLCYESDYYITSIEVIKDRIKDLIDKDNLVFAEHLLAAIVNSDAYYYEYDFSMGTLETPTPLTKIKDLEKFCDDCMDRTMGCLSIYEMICEIKLFVDAYWETPEGQQVYNMLCNTCDTDYKEIKNIYKHIKEQE